MYFSVPPCTVILRCSAPNVFFLFPRMISLPPFSASLVWTWLVQRNMLSISQSNTFLLFLAVMWVLCDVKAFACECLCSRVCAERARLTPLFLFFVGHWKNWRVQLSTTSSLQSRDQEELGHLHLRGKESRRRLRSNLRQDWCQMWVFRNYRKFTDHIIKHFFIASSL